MRRYVYLTVTWPCYYIGLYTTYDKHKQMLIKINVKLNKWNITMKK